MILLKLFLSFIKVGLFSVGGGYAAIPLIQDEIVNTNKLMTLEEFSDLITIAEMTPGSIAINSATFVGMRIAGIFGALICTAGCVLPSFVICLILAHFYYKYRNFTGVQKVLAAMRPAVVALICGAGLSILCLGVFHSDMQNIRLENFHIVEFGLFAAGMFVLRKWKVNAITVIFGSGIIGTLIYMLM